MKSTTLECQLPDQELTANFHRKDADRRTILIVRPEELREVLDAVRYRLLGTRWRRGAERVVPASAAGFLLGSEGPLPLGQVLSHLEYACGAAPLSGSERLALVEFFGLSYFPLDLVAGRAPLVGRISVSALDPAPASRSTIAALVKSGISRLSEFVEPRPAQAPYVVQAEEDPFGTSWSLSPASADRQLSDDEYSTVVRASLLGAQIYVGRARQSAKIEAALRSWSVKHGLDDESHVGAEVSSRFEHRHAAYAALSVALWRIISDESILTKVLEKDRFFWDIREPVGVGTYRVASHPKWGPANVEMSRVEFVLLAGEVFERRDSGPVADLVLDTVRSSLRTFSLGEPEMRSVLYGVGRGLAAVGSWRVLDLSRWMTDTQPGFIETARVVAFASHVASLHYQDGLAWHLCAMADRLGAEQVRSGAASSAEIARLSFQTGLIRSGCRVREAERYLLAGQLERSVKLVEASMRLVDSAHHSWTISSSDTETTDPVALALRRVEVLLVADSLRTLGHPIESLRKEKALATVMLQGVASKVETMPPQQQDDDRVILEDRVESLQQVIAGR